MSRSGETLVHECSGTRMYLERGGIIRIEDGPDAIFLTASMLGEIVRAVEAHASADTPSA